MLAELFRVDILVPVSSDPAVGEFRASMSHLPWPYFGEGLFGTPGGDREPRLIDVRHGVLELEEWRAKNQLRPDFKPAFPVVDESDPLEPALTAMFGGYPDPMETGPDYARIAIERVGAAKLDLGNGTPIDATLSSRSVPYLLSAQGLRLNHTSELPAPGVFLGFGDSPLDVVAFWNLRAAGSDLVFVDERSKERLLPLAQSHVDGLRAASARRSRDRSALWSLRSPTDPADSLGIEDLSICLVSAATWNGLNVKPSMPVFNSHFTVVSASEEGDGRRRTAYIPLEKKPLFEGDSLEHQGIVASVRAGGWTEKEDQLSFCPPWVPRLNEYYGRELYFHHENVRVEPNAVGVIVDGSSDHIPLRALDHDDVLRRIFAIADITAAPSSAGRVCRRLIRQIGGLHGCRLFKIPGVRELIRKHPPPKHFGFDSGLATVNAGFPEDPPYVEGKLVTAPSALQHLMQRGLLRAGLELTCPHCELPAWVSIDELTSERQCEYCGTPFLVTPMLGRKRWTYRGSGLLARSDNQSGAVPVALALQCIDSLIRDEMAVFCGGMDLSWCAGDGGNMKREVDLVYVANRRGQPPAIVVGECKGAMPIDARDVSTVQHVVNALERSGLEAYALFAKAGEFTGEEVERCRSARDPHRPRVILLGSRELEPADVVDRLDDLPEALRHIATISSLARLTEQTYLGDTPG